MPLADTNATCELIHLLCSHLNKLHFLVSFPDGINFDNIGVIVRSLLARVDEQAKQIEQLQLQVKAKANIDDAMAVKNASNPDVRTLERKVAELDARVSMESAALQVDE